MPEPPITDHSWSSGNQCWSDDEGYKCRADGPAFYTTRGGGVSDAKLYWWDKKDCRRIVDSAWIAGPSIIEGHHLTMTKTREVTYRA